jgi:hypothetical protein
MYQYQTREVDAVSHMKYQVVSWSARRLIGFVSTISPRQSQAPIQKEQAGFVCRNADACARRVREKTLRRAGNRKEVIIRSNESVLVRP